MTLKHVAEMEIDDLNAMELSSTVEFSNPKNERVEVVVHEDGYISDCDYRLTIPQRIALLQALAKEEDWREGIVDRLLKAGCEYSNDGLVVKNGLTAWWFSERHPFPDCRWNRLPLEVCEILLDARKKWEEEQDGA